MEGLMQLTEETAVEEILEHLAKLNVNSQRKTVNLAKHYAAIKEQYGDVLEKLAQ